MDAPPSISSAIVRNFDQQQLPLNEPYQFEETQYSTPSISDIRSMEDQSQSSEYNQLFQAMNLDRSIPQADDVVQPVSIGDMAIGRQEISIKHHQFPDQRSDIFDNSEQAPSIGYMVREGEISNAAGGNFPYDAPPSRTDVAHRDASHTGESSGGEVVEDDESLTKRNFGKFYTMEFPKEEA